MSLRALTVTEAHDKTGIPTPMIRRLLHAGAIKGNRVGMKWFISEASLEAWINRAPEQPVEPDAPSEFSDEGNPFL